MRWCVPHELRPRIARKYPTFQATERLQFAGMKTFDREGSDRRGRALGDRDVAVGVSESSDNGKAIGLLDPAEQKANVLYRKLYLHILPPCFWVVFVCFIDRTNLALAADSFCNDVKLEHGEYGLGAGAFFLGYAIFQIPSNVILERGPGHRFGCV